MEKSTECFEKISAGEKASIENTKSQPLAVSLQSDSGCCVEIDLAPGQVLTFAAGEVDAKVILPQGNPSGLLIVRPSTSV